MIVAQGYNCVWRASAANKHFVTSKWHGICPQPPPPLQKKVLPRPALSAWYIFFGNFLPDKNLW